LSEFEVTEKIEEFRGKMLYHVGPSFSTIAGYGPNGAIIHYHPEVGYVITLVVVVIIGEEGLEGASILLLLIYLFW
jgi:hypothetical protein